MVRRTSAALSNIGGEEHASVSPGRISTGGLQGVVDRQLGTATSASIWAAARLYGDALAAGNIPGVTRAASETSRGEISDLRMLPIALNAESLPSLRHLLAGAHRNLVAGDIVIVDVPGRMCSEQSIGLDRDTLSRVLYGAGFDCPFIAAGRDVLAAEPDRSSLIDILLTSGARGAAPKRFPGIEAIVEPAPDRIVAFARRSSLGPPNERTLRLSVIIPVYNERKTFRRVMEHLLAKRLSGVDIEICLVESNSTDGTRDDVLGYAEHPAVRLLLEDRPSGKGHAVRKGLEIATGDIVLIQDADLEYDLDDYERLLDPIRSLKASFVLGSRHPAGKKGWRIRQFGEQRGIADMMNLGHLFFTWFLNVMFGQRLRDPFTMYKVFRRDCVHNVRFECNRFDFDIELVGKLIRSGYQPIEIDVHYNSRSFEEGKKVSIFADPPTWIRAGIRHRFSELHFWPQRR
jgi:hypothetical protein